MADEDGTKNLLPYGLDWLSYSAGSSKDIVKIRIFSSSNFMMKCQLIKVLSSLKDPVKKNASMQNPITMFVSLLITQTFGRV